MYNFINPKNNVQYTHNTLIDIGRTVHSLNGRWRTQRVSMSEFMYYYCMPRYYMLCDEWHAICRRLATDVPPVLVDYVNLHLTLPSLVSMLQEINLNRTRNWGIFYILVLVSLK